MIMGNIGKSILGGLGIIKHELPYKPNDFYEFSKNLAQPCIILTKNRKHNFWSGGISAVTSSPWNHAAIYLGKTMSERARDIYPELLKKRVFINDNKKIELKKIPTKVCLREIIESDIFIKFDTLDKYNSNDDQLIAWMRPLTPQQIDSILFRSLLMHGMPYDVKEIASFISSFKNPEDGKIVLENGDEYFVGPKVCSSYVDYVFDLPLTRPAPGDINKYCKKKSPWSSAKFNC